MKDIDNITTREKETIKSLVSPDDPRENKYRWELGYQQEVLGMLLSDKIFLIQSMKLIKPSFFVDKAHETICSILFDYFENYGQMPPKYIILNEVRERYPDDDRKLLMYGGELEALHASYVPGIETRSSCLDKITEFAKEMALKNAVSSTLSILEKPSKDKWAKIENLWREALLTDRDFDMGLDYFQTLEERYERISQQNKSKEIFITGLNGIDDGLTSGGLCRGEIAAFMGMAGAGKSTMLTKVCVANVVRGKKVLYISLEMGQDKIANRFDAMLAQDNIRTLSDKKDTIINALKEVVKGEEDKRKLIIKQFPAGTVDVHTIRAFLAQLALYSFKPDMVCIDYVGEFKDDVNIKTYESRQRIVRDLRGLAVEENVCVFTAMQSNRMGREAQKGAFLDDDSIGDSYGQARPLDALWSINQTHEEKRVGIGRIYVIKHRDGRSRYPVYFKQDQNTLDIHEISSDNHTNLISQFTKKKTDAQNMGIDVLDVGQKGFKQNG
jgi:replicative DNA helicase